MDSHNCRGYKTVHDPLTHTEGRSLVYDGFIKLHCAQKRPVPLMTGGITRGSCCEDLVDIEF